MQSYGTAAAVGTLLATLGEGPRWDAAEQRLLWVDIEGRRLHVGDRQIACPSTVGAAAPWDAGTVLVALADRLAAVDVAGGAVRPLVDLPHASPGMRSNDGACDADGRFWIGTMGGNEGQGALYRYDPDGRLHTVLTGVTLSNGIGWDPGGTRMYYIDTPTQRVDVFAFDRAAGALSDRRVFATIPEAEGAPDGLAVDDEGGVWVALYGGSEVRHFSPAGEPVGRVHVPADNVTACCFAGRKLFITTAAGGAQPLAGRLFALEVGVSGPAANGFGGQAPSTAPSDAERTLRR